MSTPDLPCVEIVEKGRYGSVVYHEAAGSLSFFWEFGGGDTVAIIQVDDVNAWSDAPTWMTGRRAGILRFVADEVIRQKAPGSHAQIDEPGGCITLRRGKATGTAQAEAVAWMGRYSKLRMKLGLIVLIGAIIAVIVMWSKDKVFVIDPGKGTPFGLSVRAGEQIATLIQGLVPYTPSLNRDHSQDQYHMSLLLVSLDGSSAPRKVPITGALDASAFRLAKILGSDGRTLWCVVNGLCGVDLKTNALVTGADLHAANPSLDANWWEDTRGMEVYERLRLTMRDGSQVLEVDPDTHRAVQVTTKPDPMRSPPGISPGAYLCAGFFTTPTTWLGLHSPEEVERGFKPKSWVRRIERANDTKVLRQFFRGVLSPESSDESRKVLTMLPVDSTTYLNAAFLRVDDRSEPMRLTAPEGALMVYTSRPGLKGTLMITRVDTAGKVLWKVDTGIDRFNLSQILPGDRSMAFIGPRPMVPGMVSEPLLVIVDNSTGAASTCSLWQ